MSLKTLLEEKKVRLADRWFDCVAQTYPPETAQFLNDKKNRFGNPVGAAFARAMGPLVEELIRGGEAETVSRLLDEIIRIRAVQEFSPSGAVAAVLLLKRAVREELAKEIAAGGMTEEILDLESKIDGFALLAFDVYMKCREQLWQIRMDDFMKRPYFQQEGAMCLSYMIRREEKLRKQGEQGKDSNGNSQS